MQADSVLRKLPQRIWPVLAVLCAVVVVWYGGAFGLNAPQVTERFERDKLQYTTAQLIEGTWSMKRPLLPAPHQVAADLRQTIFVEPVDTPQNLLYHTFSTAVTTLTIRVDTVIVVDPAPADAPTRFEGTVDPTRAPELV